MTPASAHSFGLKLPDSSGGVFAQPLLTVFPVLIMGGIKGCSTAVVDIDTPFVFPWEALSALMIAVSSRAESVRCHPLL